MFDPNLFQVLKKGGVIPVQQDNSYALLSKVNQPAFSGFLHSYTTYVEEGVILISEIGQLSMYLQKVPELAWDIVEYADKSLQVIFKGGRNVPEFVYKKEHSIAIRLEKKGIMHKVIFNMGGTLLLLRLSPAIVETEFWQQFDKILNLPDSFEWQVKPEKIMALSENGEIKFYE